jgi:hypothetical protein
MFQDKLTREIAAAAAQIKTEPPKNEVNTKSVEGAVVSIMANEELKGNQHKIDANKNGKVDAHDFKLLRAGKKPDVKKEEVEQLDEIGDTPAGRKTLGSYVMKSLNDKNREKGLRKATSRLYKDNYYGKKTNEEVEELDELFGKGKLPQIAAYHKQKGAEAKGKMETIRNTNTTVPVPKEKSAKIYAKDAEAKYHSTQEKRAKSLMKKEEVEKVDEAFPTVADAAKRLASKESNFEKKKISTGTVYSRKYKAEPEDNDETPKKKAKTMKEMLSIYSTGGAEALVENLMIEEPSQDEYKKEIEVAHAKAEGKIRNDKGIAKAAAQGVKMEEVEIEVLDADEINGVQIDNIEERSLTDAEMNKREDIVKSMKKGIQGFKDRYGDRAKEVMYATATKQAKKD